MVRAAVVCLLWITALQLRVPPAATRPVPLWRVPAEGRGVPALAGSTAYFLTKRHDVVAVDAATGIVRWRVGTREPGEETLGSSILVSGSVVVLGDYTVFGLDAASGALRWRFEPGNGYGAGLYLGEGEDGLVFAGSPSGRLYAINAADGRLGWSTHPVEKTNTTVFQPIVAGDLVVAGYSTFGTPVTGGLLAVDRATGRERWRREFPPFASGATGFGGGPLATGDLVVAASGDGRIHGVDRFNGFPRWVRPPVTRADGRTTDADWRALSLTGSCLVAGSVTGIVTMIDMLSGREIWRYAHPAGGSVAMRITADDRSVYVPHLGGLLVALGVRDGRERWEIGGLGDGFSWAPALAGERAYVAASRTGLFALPR